MTDHSETRPGDQTTLSPETVLENQYKIERLVAQSGSGFTYLAHDAKSGVQVVVKEYFPLNCATRQLTDSHVVPTSPAHREHYMSGLEQFRNEARVLADLCCDSRIPGIAKVVNSLDAFGTTYMVMEHIAGQSLARLLNLDYRNQPTEATKPLPPERVQAILSEVLDGIEPLHARGVLHRGITPANVILLYSTGSPVLIGFAAAHKMLTGTGPPLVFPPYSPPEQYSPAGANQGPWTDIYALAATAYVALTGRVPPESTERVLALPDDPFQPLAKMATQSPATALYAAVDSALAIAFRKRPQTVFNWRQLLLSPL